MRMHTALHVMSAVIKGNVTGGQVNADKSRLDFNLEGDVPTKEWVTEEINKILAVDRPVTPQWVTDEELNSRPELVKTMSVRPPMGAGRVRLLSIEGVDLQACGGTHVARTGEIGRVECTKIENKGKMNRRFIIACRNGAGLRPASDMREEAEEWNTQDPTRWSRTDWLAARLDAPDIRVVDGSFYLPAAKRDPKAEFANQHIPGAVFFDIDEIADTSSPLPHMLPSPEKFSSRVRKLGLGDGSKIVVYDTTPMTGACRVWWMFRTMGHKDVAVLDGGLPKWMAEGHPVTDDPTPPRDRHFTARLNNTLVRSVDDVFGLIDSKREQIVDARAANRFRGEVPEPRAGLRVGHMPGAYNLPYNELLDPKTGTMLPADKLAARIAASGIDPSKKVTASCGSGVTACVVALGLYLTGAPETAVYDGSWTEWGGRADTPIVTGS